MIPRRILFLLAVIWGIVGMMPHPGQTLAQHNGALSDHVLVAAVNPAGSGTQTARDSKQIVLTIEAYQYPLVIGNVKYNLRWASTGTKTLSYPWAEGSSLTVSDARCTKTSSTTVECAAGVTALEVSYRYRRLMFTGQNTFVVDVSSTSNNSFDLTYQINYPSATNYVRATLPPTSESANALTWTRSWITSFSNRMTFSLEEQISATALEVTQGIQDLNNNVVLIAERPTYVRAHVQSKPGDQTNVSAVLHGQRNGIPLPGSPLAPSNLGGTITVKNNPDRGQLNDSFFFRLPLAWRTGTVELELDMRNARIGCASSLPDCKTRVDFDSSTTLYLRFLDAGNTVPDRTYYIAALNVFERLPVPTIDWDRGRSLKVNPVRSGKDLLLKLHKFKMIDNCINPSCKYHYVSLYPPSSSIFYTLENGVAHPGGATAVALLTRPDVLSHELGHNFNRDHPLCRGDEGTGNQAIDGFFPHPGGKISTDTAGPAAFYGFNIRSTEIYHPGTGDLMSYCFPNWPSAHTYTGIWNDMVSRYGTTLATATLAATDHAIIVSGVITPTQGTATLEPLYTLDAPSALPAPAPGSYTLRFKDAAGDVLASYPFEPDTPVELATTTSDEPDLRSFVLALPWPAGVARVELLRGEQLLATRSASASPPTVTVTNPNGGENLSSAPVTLSWNASDPDGDPLVYVVQYSRDNGATWETIALDLSATTLELDPADFPGGDQSLFRVQASDGFHTAVDQSDAVFSVARHAPEAFIEGLANGGMYVGEQMLLLDGSAYDREDGMLPATALRWSSNRDGALDIGAELTRGVAAMSAGTHTITLTATDSDGQSATASVTIQVYRERPTLPAGFSLAPGEMGLVASLASNTTLTRTLTLRNSGDGELNWSASADQPWASLSSTSGSAPADLVLTLDPRGLAAGEHTATIAFSAPDVTAQAINVYLYVQEAPSNPRIYLPLVRR